MSRGYEDQVPAVVPDAQESNSESVWAMFQQSIINTEERVAVAAELAAAKAKDDAVAEPGLKVDTLATDSDFADTNFDATRFDATILSELPSEPPYDPTAPSPLKPQGS
jgi:hypothetical protein